MILIIDDNETIREGLGHTVRKMGHEAILCGNGADGVARFRAAAEQIDFVITDLKMEGVDGVAVLREIAALDPDAVTMIVTGYGTVETAVEAMKLGAFDFLTKPFPPEVVRLKVERALALRRARRAHKRTQATLEAVTADGEARYGELIGGAPEMRRIYAALPRIAQAESSVLVTGESGTGKELVARALHAQSRRAGGPFIKVNCGALADTLLESELFGHEKGAFTGAIKRKLGRFELADGGTLFLDEVGDVSPSMQLKLLRAVQERELERVGGEQTIRVDVRIIAATHKHLADEVAAGRFREDLRYRLHVVEVALPPLRERREDIPLLVAHFLAKLAPRTNPRVTGVSDEALARLMAYSWPGNVRELENVVEQSMIFTDGEAITLAALPLQIRGEVAPRTTPDVAAAPTGSLPEILDDLERQLIKKAFDQAKGVKTETARLLGIKPSALYYKLEKYGIA
jgi:two-component system, NtrC family, response regulator HydG